MSKHRNKNSSPTVISKTKKRIFFLLMIIIPLLFFIVVEGILQKINYAGDLKLFIDGPPGYEKYYRCNPNVARRYFTVQTVIPTPPHQLFLKTKPPNGYRIFVLGESSAAGFPYGPNASFPNVLWSMLRETYPNRYIEVINLSLSAINSYTLLDFIDEILEQSPDLIILYAGHNEYYGALGVGSAQSLSPFRSIVKLYLSLNNVKTFLLLRDIVGWLKMQVSNILYKGNVTDPTATLMENIVAQQVIPYKSTLYEIGKNQFQENIKTILQLAQQHKIPVIIGELVSNERDQPPFISIDTEGEERADSVYRRAQEEELKKNFEIAKKLYRKAKDLDALRFRAPSEFNSILHELSQQYNQPYVHLLEAFEVKSPNGIIGNNLMHEHLHPTKEGYYLMALAFYQYIQSSGMVDTLAKEIVPEKIWRSCVTELDSVYAELSIRHLKGSWPFQPKGVPNRFADQFVAKDSLETLAFKVLLNKDFSILAAHMELGQKYEQSALYSKAYREYSALIASIPQEMEFYNKAAFCLLKEQKYDTARILLSQSLNYGNNPFAYKWLGLIALMKQDTLNAIGYLTKANQSDPQVLFNLSRTYFSLGKWTEAERYFEKLKSVAPRSEYTSYLQAYRFVNMLKKSGKTINK